MITLLNNWLEFGGVISQGLVLDKSLTVLLLCCIRHSNRRHVVEHILELSIPRVPLVWDMLLSICCGFPISILLRIGVLILLPCIWSCMPRIGKRLCSLPFFLFVSIDPTY